MGKTADQGPLHEISFSWYPLREPGTAQEVTVTFREIPGGSLVELVYIG